MKPLTLNLFFFSLFLALFGCDSKNNTSTETNKNTNQKNVSLPADLFLKDSPKEAKTISNLRKEGKSGEKITLTGYLGGRKEPFTENRAIFLLADNQTIPPCQDACDAPWDACCETPEDIAANVATIQIVDEKGAPLKISLKNQQGLKPMAQVIVQGTIQQKDEHVFIVNAEHLYVQP